MSINIIIYSKNILNKHNETKKNTHKNELTVAR